MKLEDLLGLLQDLPLTLIKTSSKSQRQMVVRFYYTFHRFPTTLEKFTPPWGSFLDEGHYPYQHLVSFTTDCPVDDQLF